MLKEKLIRYICEQCNIEAVNLNIFDLQLLCGECKKIVERAKRLRRMKVVKDDATNDV